MAVHYESRGRRFICPAGRSPGTLPPPPGQTAALFTERLQMSAPLAPNVIEFAHSPENDFPREQIQKSFNQCFSRHFLGNRQTKKRGM